MKRNEDDDGMGIASCLSQLDDERILSCIWWGREGGVGSSPSYTMRSILICRRARGKMAPKIPFFLLEERENTWDGMAAHFGLFLPITRHAHLPPLRLHLSLFPTCNTNSISTTDQKTPTKIKTRRKVYCEVRYSLQEVA